MVVVPGTAALAQSVCWKMQMVSRAIWEVVRCRAQWIEGSCGQNGSRHLGELPGHLLSWYLTMMGVVSGDAWRSLLHVGLIWKAPLQAVLLLIAAHVGEVWVFPFSKACTHFYELLTLQSPQFTLSSSPSPGLHKCVPLGVT